ALSLPMGLLQTGPTRVFRAVGPILFQGVSQARAPGADPRQGRVMSRRKKIYEGKAKILYEGPEAGTLVQYFKDDATAFNNQKRGRLEGKGVLNNRISEFVFTGLERAGVPTHFVRRLNMREQLIREVEII